MQKFINLTFRNIKTVFVGKNLLWQIFAILATYILVMSGFDWQYFMFMRENAYRPLLFIGEGLGYLYPIFLPITLFILYLVNKKHSYKNTSLASAQSVVIAFVIGLFYKGITNRISPPHHGVIADNSNAFNFGFFEIFPIGGWPSQHTAVAFALSFCLITLFPKSNIIKFTTITLSLFISLGVAIAWHWFSEIFAGAILGIVIGLTVGKSYKQITN